VTRSFVVFDTIEEAVALANDGPYRLGAGIFGEPEQAAAIGRRLAAGRVMINDGPLYSDYALPIPRLAPIAPWSVAAEMMRESTRMPIPAATAEPG
jgi:hypothetical protein